MDSNGSMVIRRSAPVRVGYRTILGGVEGTKASNHFPSGEKAADSPSPSRATSPGHLAATGLPQHDVVVGAGAVAAVGECQERAIARELRAERGVEPGDVELARRPRPAQHQP